MNENIIKFISQQTCATVSCVDATNKPYSFSCFYAFNEKEGLLYYKSSLETKHSQIILEHPFVAGTILPDKLNKIRIRGLQFEGEVLPVTHPDAKNAADIYYHTHPLAMAIGGEVWTIKVNSIKYTDSSLGFGKKVGWRREVKELV
ncbi:MAG: pyridoxamine 5'-phosphate oxidase family protein [Sphingobacteriales bacterium]|nr:pyridoxamine 5'-phosphate oxidase family protein [Sphingobacteriales bacterium]MBI3720683.1 pyridoxamine 5'-phosphate oxidase family protein [Sphingobacteriales bacterium]